MLKNMRASFHPSPQGKPELKASTQQGSSPEKSRLVRSLNQAEPTFKWNAFPLKCSRRLCFFPFKEVRRAGLKPSLLRCVAASVCRCSHQTSDEESLRRHRSEQSHNLRRYCRKFAIMKVLSRILRWNKITDSENFNTSVVNGPPKLRN